MPILTQRALVMAKVEATAGTDSVPAPATDAFLVADPVVSVQTNMLERNFARTDFSTYASRAGRKLAQVTFSIQLHGSGTAATSPKWAALLRGCGMNEATVTGPPALRRWSPRTDGMQTVTIYVYFEGLLHRMTGCMGTFSITAEAGGYAVINFTFTGNYNRPQAQAMPVNAVFEDIVPPQVELAQFAYGADAALVVNAFTLDAANTVVARPDVNSTDGFRGVRISNRNPTGGFDPEAEVDQTFWQQLEESTQSTVNMRIGSTAGNHVLLTAPKAQITGVGYGDREGLRSYELALAFRRNTGNDEYTLEFI
jgi:hypothetical protein